MDQPASPPPAAPAPPPARTASDAAPLWARWMQKLLAPWIEIKREPTVPPFVVDRPICYVLENYGLSNTLILDRACREAGLPSPFVPLPNDPLGRKRAYIALSRRGRSAFGGPRNKTHSDGLSRLLLQHRTYPDLDVQLVPVSIFVGRAPTRQSGWFSVLFSENWALVGRFRRLLAILLNGRDTVVQFSPSVRVWEILGEEQPSHERTVRKTARVLRAHFHKIRAAVIGPDLSTRRLLVDRVLDAEPVRKAITDQARRDGSEYLEAWKKAHGFAWEIAADYSNPVVRSISFMLTPVWNRIYDGVQLHHLEALKQIAPGHEVVYVPSHRSHMDYLLLSYSLYQHGLVPPHIAAGDNLNLPVIGSLLRRGGAFFLRRSIRNNALYSAVFSEYVAQLVGDGFPMEYFIEGGRSRTGRLLAPKGGMIAMTVRGFLRAPRRPVVFVPVYIGYEKLIEGNSYLDELTGSAKRKESIWGLLRGIRRVLGSHYGKVGVSFGEPIFLDDVLAKHAPAWRDEREPGDKPAWLAPVVDELAHSIQVNVNRAADANPVNLLAIALLSTPKYAMSETDLLAQLALSKKLLAALPYSPRATVTPMSPEEMVAYGERMGVTLRTRHPLGDVIALKPDTAILQTYFRNNVLHLFAAAAWVALCFQNNRRLSRGGLMRLGRTIYPFIQAELFLPWTEDGFAQRLDATVDLFIAEGLLAAVEGEEGGWISRGPGQTDEVFRLRAIAHSLQQAFERYFIAITTLVKNGPRTVSAGELETLCQLAAQRLSLLYAPAAPEFFDKSLFRGFITKLRELDLVRVGDNGKLDFDDRLNQWEKDAKLVLSRELRATIMKISPEVVVKVAEQQQAQAADKSE